MPNPRSSLSRPAGSPARSRILLVEDHPLMREGIATWINRQPDLQVCAEAGSVGEALEQVEAARPDLVVADFTLPGRNGLELLKDLKVLNPDLPVLILSMHDDRLYALRTLRAGARGYVMKKAGGEQLVAAIRQVLAGQRAFSPEVTEQILDDLSGRRSGHHSPVAALTDREFEVFEMLGHGRTNQEIASELNLSGKTVQTHRINIRNKLHLRSTPELIRSAVQHVEGESARPGGDPASPPPMADRPRAEGRKARSSRRGGKPLA